MTAVFLLCTIILFVLQTLSMKLQHAEHLPQKLLVNCAFSLLAAAAMGAGRLAVPDMFTVSPATLRHGIAFGVLFALTILFYNLAIASGPLSYTTFYFSASMLVPAFAGVLLFGEALTFTLAAAVALFLAAFWCLNVAPGGAQKPEPRWLALCALTFLCNGLCAVVQKSQQNATGGAEAAGLMLVGFCTAAACYALAYLALRGRLPIFGICLGHQMISLACGAKTFKMKFGHRGGNHPVREIDTGKIEITSQNHSFAVDEKSLEGTGLRMTHQNLLDGTPEGVESVKDKLFSVQYHPESAPGPQDSAYLFTRFINMMEEKA